VIRALALASHPAPAAAVTAAATLLAVGVGHRPGGVATIAAVVLASQLSIGWVNDWLDADRDRIAGRPDKPVAAGQVSRRAVGVAGLVAGLATVAMSPLAGPRAAALGLLGLASAQLYNWPLKSSPLSVLPYLVSFGALPAFVVLALPGAPAPPWWLVLSGSLLGGGAHFANVLPDLEADARTGVRGLPHRLGPAGSRYAAAALLLAASAVLAYGTRTWLGLGVLVAAALVLPVGLWLGRRAGSRAAFHAVLVVALADAVLLVVALRR